MITLGRLNVIIGVLYYLRSVFILCRQWFINTCQDKAPVSRPRLVTVFKIQVSHYHLNESERSEDLKRNGRTKPLDLLKVRIY